MGLLLRGAHLPGNTGGGLQAGGGGRREVKGRRDGWRDEGCDEHGATETKRLSGADSLQLTTESEHLNSQAGYVCVPLAPRKELPH